MQNKNALHKQRTLYAIKNNKAVKNKINDKRLYNNSDERYDYVPSVPNIHSDWS